MTIAPVNATTAATTAALGEIDAYALRILDCVPMDCDAPHVHLGVRALVARLHDIVDGLSAAAREGADIEWLVPDAAEISDLDARFELLAEIDAIGSALLAVIGDGAQRAAVEPLVERMKDIACGLVDDHIMSEQH